MKAFSSRRLHAERLEDRRLLAGSLELVQDVNPQNEGASANTFFAWRDLAVFHVESSTGPNLWRTDATAEGTFPLLDLEPRAFRTDAAPFGDQIVIFARTSVDHIDVYLSDGENAELAPAPLDAATWEPQRIGEWGGRLLVGNVLSDGAVELWSLDPVAREWSQIDLIPSISTFVGVSPLGATSSGAVFLVNSQVWQTDGTEGGALVIAPSTVQPSYIHSDTVSYLDGEMRFWAKFGDELGWWVLGADADELLPLQTPVTPDAQLFQGYWYYGHSSKDGIAGLYRSPLKSPETEELVHEFGYIGQYFGLGDLTEVDGLLYFLAPNDDGRFVLWQTDGTSDGTTIAASVTPSAGVFIEGVGTRQLVGLADSLAFVASNSAGAELWTYQPGVGARLLRDIRPGSLSSSPDNFLPFGSGAIFTAEDGVHGRELWITDGTTDGTRLIVDLQNKGKGSLPNGFAVAGDQLFFVAQEATSDYDLWVADAKGQGAHKVSPHGPSRLYPLGDRVVYSVRDSTTNETLWWSTNGEAPEPFHPELEIADMSSIGDKVYFSGDDGLNGLEPWVSDGTPEGTRMIANLARLGSHSEPNRFEQHGDKVYFLANVNRDLRKLWETDGTEAGTTPVSAEELGWIYDYQIHGDSVWVQTRYKSRVDWHLRSPQTEGEWRLTDVDQTNPLALFDGAWLELREDDEHGVEPYYVDAVSGAARLVADLSPGPLSSSVTKVLPGLDGYFFRASVRASASEGPSLQLWFTTDFQDGVQFVADDNLEPRFGIEVGKTMIFPLDTGLIRSDGTAEGTYKLDTFTLPYPAGLYPNPWIIALEGSIYFQGFSYEVGRELWKWTPPPGDVDFSGGVDLVDFQLLKSAFGAVGEGLTADLNHDGAVDLVDFNVLKSNFGVQATSPLGEVDVRIDASSTRFDAALLAGAAIAEAYGEGEEE